MHDRIVKIIEYCTNSKRPNVSAFARSIGIGFQTVKNYLAGRDPSCEFLVAILKTYPEISAEWLMRGEGKMLREQIPFSAPKEEVNIEPEKLYKIGELFSGIGGFTTGKSDMDAILGAAMRRYIENTSVQERRDKTNIMFEQLTARLDRIEQSLEQQNKNQA